MQKTGDEPILFRGKDTGLCLRDFWRWGFSDLLDNTLRGIYSEFIVAVALGLDISATRINWESWDLTLRGEQSDIRIEVKSCSYLQAWEQNGPSAIKFSIRPTLRWSVTNSYSGDRRRQSDVYVFCVFTETDMAKADPMNLDSWDFYVISTRELDEQCGEQKTISLSVLLRLGAEKTDFSGLKASVLRKTQDISPAIKNHYNDDHNIND